MGGLFVETRNCLFNLPHMVKRLPAFLQNFHSPIDFSLGSLKRLTGENLGFDVSDFRRSCGNLLLSKSLLACPVRDDCGQNGLGVVVSSTTLTL
jgi:hypothetical protein